MPLGNYKHGQVKSCGTLASPDRPCLLYEHGTTPLKVLMTGQGQDVTEGRLTFVTHPFVTQLHSSSCYTVSLGAN